MFEKPTAQFPIGLEPHDGELKGALLTLKGGKPKILRLFIVPIDKSEQAPHHLTILNEADPPLPRDPLRQALIVTGTTTQETLIRTLDIKLTKEKDIDAVLAFQAEPLIPYPIDQAILEKVVLATDENGSQLTVFAVRKDHLQQHLDRFNELNIEPESVGCYPAALATFAKQYTQLQEPAFLIHLAVDAVSTLLIDDGKVLAGHASPHGVGAMINEIQRQELSLDSLDFHAVAADPQSALFPFIETLRLELSRTIYALTKQARGQEISALLVTGEGVNLGNLADFLSVSLKKAIVLPQASFDPEVATRDLQRFALPIGLALGALDKAMYQINFRKGSLSYPHPWRRLKRPLAQYIVWCVVISLLLVRLGSQSVDSSLDTARDQYRGILAIMGTDHAAFEKKAFGIPPEEVVPIDKMSMDTIDQRIDWIEEEIKNTPTIFPLMPNIPRVSDVLAWLCSNPKVLTVDKATGEKVALLQIENFGYSMTKRPDKNKQREHYQVKVEVEFSSKDPMWARQFYDMLLAPNAFVDPKGEIKWSAAQGRYRTSFFLRDKTYYP